MDSLIVIGLATISLGTIHEADGPKEHDFWLRNTGSEAVAITQGYTSCGCTTVVFSKDSLIASGDSTRVTLRFNPRGKGGDFEETATLVYSPKREEQGAYSLPSRKAVHLSLVGTCITSEETLLRQYPVRVCATLRISADRFDLGILRVGETRERSVAILHIGNQKTENQSFYHREAATVTFTVAPDTPKGLQHFPYTLRIGDKEVTITLDAVIK